MQALILSVIVAVMTVGYAATALALPGVVKLIPELIAALAVPYIILAGSRQRFRFLQPKYLVVFGFLAFSMLCGILINDVDAGPTIAGLRTYLRVVPLFLLPAVFSFTDEQLAKQLKLLLFLSLLQTPFAAYQRWQLWQESRFTGDLVMGTLGDSGILSVFLISAVTLLTALMLRDRLSKGWFTVLFFALLIPTTINETKVTVILLPLGLIVALAVGSPRGARLKIVGAAAGLLVLFGAIFIPVYNLMQTNNPYAKDITTFFTDKRQLDKYLEAKYAGVGTTRQVGRGDALRIPVEYVSEDPVRMAFGLGIGNSSESSLGRTFSGKFAPLFARIMITGFSAFVLELGLLGTALIFLFYWLIFRDALYVARHDRGLVGAIGVGWTGVTAVIALATLYANTQVFESLSFLFWYFAGLVCARRAQLMQQPTLPRDLVAERSDARASLT